MPLISAVTTTPRTEPIGETQPTHALQAPSTTAPQPPPRVLEQRVIGVRPQRQKGNACGTTSMAMALTRVLGRRVTQVDTDQVISRQQFDAFSSSKHLVRVAEKFDVTARRLDRMSQTEIVEQLRAGRPILFLSDMSPQTRWDVSRLHWRVIDGFRIERVTAEDGTETARVSLHVVDPHNKQGWHTWNDLEPYWGNIRALGLTTGAQHFGIVVGADTEDANDDGERTFGMWTSALISRWAAATAYRAGEVFKEGKLRSIPPMVGDAVVTLLSTPVYLVGSVVRWPLAATRGDGRDFILPTRGERAPASPETATSLISAPHRSFAPAGLLPPGR